MPVTHDDLLAALPDVTSPLGLRGLEAPVTVWRDEQGIPHVQARTAHDAFFAQGFVAAQDRLWQMEYDRRRAYGRWAEYAGPSAVGADIAMRRFRLRASAERDYAALDGDARAMLDAYAEGVSAFIALGRLPVEYRLVGAEPGPWRPQDSLAVFKVRHLGMGLYESKLWRARVLDALGPVRAARLFRNTRPGDLLIIPPDAEYDGAAIDPLPYFQEGAQLAAWTEEAASGTRSTDALREPQGERVPDATSKGDHASSKGNTEGESNSWVLHGSRTASGKPLLAGDSHRPLDTPNVYYQNHIACPEFDVIGLSFPGFPGFPHFGHNARVAWCVTHTTADYQDLYVERFDPSGAPRYEYRGEWRDAETHQETVQVRGGKPVDITVTFTHHGPVVLGGPGAGYGVAFRYTATAEDAHTFVPCVRRMLSTRDVAELDEAMRGWVDPCNNLLSADVDGNIAYLNRGRMPIRAMSNAWLPVAGWTGAHEWKGEIPFEDWLRLRNPEAGYIVTANNRVAGTEYPYYLSQDFAPDLRARRVLARIDPLTSATVEDMAAIHAESVSLLARRTVALLSHIPAHDPLTERAKTVLTSWDGAMERDAVAPTIYSAFRRGLDARLAPSVLGPLADTALAAVAGAPLAHVRRLTDLFVHAAEEDDRTLLPDGADWPSVLSDALTEAVSYLRERLGDDVDSWTWGRLHVTRPRHTLSAAFPEDAPLLDPPSVPLGGDGDTPLRGSHVPSRPFEILGGLSVARYVFDMSDWENSGWVAPLGVSGHPGSPHYADQAAVWSDVRLLPMRYGWPRIEREAATRQELAPNTD